MRLKDWANGLGYKQDNYYRVLSYGEYGSGKTRFAGTFPDPFIIDTDRGLKSLIKAGTCPPQHRILSLQKGDSTFKIVKDVLLSLRDAKAPFTEDLPKAVIIDSMTSLGDLILYEAMTNPGTDKVKAKQVDYEKPEFDHWGMLRNRLQTLWDILKDVPMHVCVTAGVKVEKDDALGKFVGLPSLQGSARDIIGHAFDEVYYFRPEGSGNKIKYTVYTKAYDFYHAKTREDLPAKIEDPSFNKLYTNKQE